MSENKRNKSRLSKPRNPMIVAAFKKEINLQTQVVKDKTKYTRKQKHSSNTNNF